MAELDVSDILADVDFSDTFQVQRSVRTVAAHGRTLDSPSVIDTAGVVQPASGEQLEQLPDAERTTGSIAVYTQFRLVSLTDTTAPDIILWHGRQYLVQAVNDFSNYGIGYVQATCTLMNMTGDGP